MRCLVPLLLASFLAAQQDPPDKKPPYRVPVKFGRITLPPRPAQEEKPKAAQQPQNRSDLNQFHRDVIDLRRSKALTAADEEALLRQLEVRYDDPAGMAIKLSHRCGDDLLYGLMKVVDRYGRKYHAEELHFQVLTRPLGRATTRVVKTIAAKAAESAKPKLFDYLVCKFAPARSAAVDVLTDMLAIEDVPRVLQVSRASKVDIRRKVLELLARLDDDRVRARIGEILEDDAALAGDACEAALKQGASMVSYLQGLAQRPPRNQAFGYAVFALTRLESELGRDLLTKEMIPHLHAALEDRDPFLRVSSAIALGAIAYRSSDWLDRSRDDKRVVDSLLDVVAPERFVRSLRLLKPTASEVLVNLSGRNFYSKSTAWRSWWEEAHKDFIGLGRTLTLTADNADSALLLWSTDQYSFAFRGTAVPDASVPAGATAFFVDHAMLQGLLGELRGLGFMEESRLPAVPNVWTLDLRAGGARVMMRVEASRDGRDRGARIHDVIAKLARAELWQKHRDPERHPDAAAFWRAEHKWRAEHPDKRGERLVELIVQRLPKIDAAARKDALDDLQSLPDLRSLITEIRGADLVAACKKIQKFEDSDLRILEIAMLAPGDTVWRQALGALGEDPRGGELASRLFRLMEPERVLVAIEHPNQRIAVAAIHDAAAARNRAAIPILMKRMKDTDGIVQRTAIFALGQLGAVEARDALVAYEATAHPLIRREIWGALGRIGGAEVPALLKKAMQHTAEEDRMAVIAAMGHTDSPELARFLAARFVTGGGVPEFDEQAKSSLRNMGAILAIPSLRQHLSMQEGPRRNELVMLLGEMHDSGVVPDLIDLLQHPQHERVAAEYLAEITGQDLRPVDNRARFMQIWYATNRNLGQGQWFLSALEAARVQTTLRSEHLAPRSGVGAVGELSRLVIELQPRHLRVMAATLMRETTGADFIRGVRFAEGAALQAIVDRYRIHAEMSRAAAR